MTENESVLRLLQRLVRGLLIVTLHCSLQGCVQCADVGGKYLILYKGVDSLQHPLAGELIGQVGLNLLTQTQRVGTLGPARRLSLPVHLHLLCSAKGGTSNREEQQAKPLLCFHSLSAFCPSLSAARKGESSRSLVGSGLPRITKHMRLWPVPSAQQTHCSYSLGREPRNARSPARAC